MRKLVVKKSLKVFVTMAAFLHNGSINLKRKFTEV